MAKFTPKAHFPMARLICCGNSKVDGSFEHPKLVNVKTDGYENIYNFKLKNFIHLYTKPMNMSEIIHQNEKAGFYENRLRPLDKNA